MAIIERYTSTYASKKTSTEEYSQPYSLMFKKIRFGSSIAALFLFVFPWLDIQCSEKSMVTQTGIQMIYGGGSLSPEMKASGDNSILGGNSKPSDSFGFSPLIGLSLLIVIAAVACSYFALFHGSGHADRYASFLPTAALICVVIQLLVGFPAKNKIADSMSLSDSKSKNIQSLNDPFSGLGAAMGASMAMNIRVKTLPSFYFLLLALSLPTLILANSFIDNHKQKCEQDAPSNGG